MKTIKSSLTVILIILALTTALIPSAAAAGTVNPETDTGTITVTLKKDGSGIAGIRVKLWRVGIGKVTDHQLVFEPLPELQDAELELNGLSGTQNTQTAAMLLDLCDARGLIPDTWEQTTDAAGSTRFDDLPVGVYLVQSASTVSYRAITPYLLQLPAQNGEGTAWDFDIQGTPKVEAQPSGGDDPLPDPPPPDNPPPENPPSSGPEPSPGETPPAPENPEPQLPQTGLLQWPIPLLAVAGLLLITMGLAKKQKDGCT